MPPLKPAQEATARIDVIRTALAAGAGVGAAITLMLAFRRQRHHESVAESTEHDANERRVTELYTKAAEQLGNDQAPVRLAGLYALERLAQLTPDQRQTIVNVICAYLRMSYTPPPGNRHDKIRAAQRATHRGGTARSSAAPGGRDSQEEQQVRITAHRILTDHLRYVKTPPPGRWPKRRCRQASNPNARFWPGIRLDLTGATLLDFDFTDCCAASALFGRATFTGSAVFSGAAFTGSAWFDGATFTGSAWFNGATFTGDSRFDGATFTGNAVFSGADFTDSAWFNGATFTGDSRFDGAAFTDSAWFEEATFTRDSRFDGATFTGNAVFSEASFFDEAVFGGATFTRGPEFDEVCGAEKVDLEGAFVSGEVEPMQVPEGWWREIGPDGRTRLRRDVPPAAPGDATEGERGEVG
ncbi:pentapeptide repeat-containing protein [Streptosporangium sp. G11]|uniref:pentapeptide repeat-containing protein n=1 Tax=Streptosporangium sp. G11 TaxID=3436926 RepID=UPI003EB7049D